MLHKSLGAQELELLQYLAEQGPATAAEVALGYGEARGLARSTIHTMLERLRRKGYVGREKYEGVYRYASSVLQSELLHNAVGHFFQRTLHNSLSLLVAYLAQADDLRDEEIAELKSLVKALEARTQGGNDG